MAKKRKKKSLATRGDSKFVSKSEQQEKKKQALDNNPMRRATDIGEAMMKAKMGGGGGLPRVKATRKK